MDVADTLTIEPLHTLPALRTCEELQKAIWRLEEREIVPDHVMLKVARHGGVMLGARIPSGDLVGMLMGFPGVGDAEWGVEWLHYSHMMGVLPAWQSRGVGYRLKLAQRAHVLRQGIVLVVWTYDPLESRNAALNIGKLGAICRRYGRDMYGTMRDELNAGLESDRFEVEWWIGSERVRRRIEGKRRSFETLRAMRPANRVMWRADGLPVPADATESAWDSAPARLEIPPNIQRIRQADMALAHTWRLHVRAQCEAAFAAGYTVVDFASGMDGERGTRRSFYVLEARPSSPGGWRD